MCKCTTARIRIPLLYKKPDTQPEQNIWCRHSEALEYHIPICISKAVVPEEAAVVQRYLLRSLQHHLRHLLEMTGESI